MGFYEKLGYKPDFGKYQNKEGALFKLVYNVLIAFGGGKVLDVTKAVIVDTDIIAAAPERYLKAGIVDTLAKWYEPDFSGSFSGEIAKKGSKLAFDELVQHGPAVLENKKTELWTSKVACKAAYTGGEEWLAECRDYLEGNLRFIKTFLAEKLPEIKLIEPEGTYFAWMDFSALGLSDRELDELILSKAGLWLDAGHIFGKGGSGFQRLAYSCTRATLTEALNRLFYAIHGKRDVAH